MTETGRWIDGHRLAAVLCALAAALPSAAHAGGLDRSGQGVGALFEPGNYLELKTDVWMPQVRGTDPTGHSTGNVLEARHALGLSAKFELDPRWSAAVIIDEPFGANVRYGESSPWLGGTQARMSSLAALGLLRYQFGAGFSGYGGPRLQQIDGAVALQGAAFGALSGYRADFASGTALGYTAGLAYERPELGVRVATTYHSAVTHHLATREQGALSGLNGNSDTTIRMPEAVNVWAQTGVTRSTLLFAQLRWVNWSALRIDPAQFQTVTGSGLVSLHDTRSYLAGVGQDFGGGWSGAAIAYSEVGRNEVASALAPTQGYRGLSLSLTRQLERLRITGMLYYFKFGDAQVGTAAGGADRAVMNGNSSLGVGLRLGWAL